MSHEGAVPPFHPSGRERGRTEAPRRSGPPSSWGVWSWMVSSELSHTDPMVRFSNSLRLRFCVTIAKK